MLEGAERPCRFRQLLATHSLDISECFSICSYTTRMQLKDEQVVKIGITIWTIIFLGALVLQLTNDKYGHWAITSVIGVALGLFGLRAIKNRK